MLADAEDVRYDGEQKGKAKRKRTTQPIPSFSRPLVLRLPDEAWLRCSNEYRHSPRGMIVRERLAKLKI